MSGRGRDVTKGKKKKRDKASRGEKKKKKNKSSWRGGHASSNEGGPQGVLAGTRRVREGKKKENTEVEKHYGRVAQTGRKRTLLIGPERR